MRVATLATKSGARIRKAVGSPLGRNVGVLTISGVVVNGLAMVQGLLAARWLGPAAYGTAVLIVAFPEFVFTLLEARTIQATVRYGSGFDERGDTDAVLAVLKVGYLVDSVVAIAAFALVAALSHFAARLFDLSDAPASLIVAYAAMSLLFRPLAPTSRGVLVIAGKFRSIAAIDIVSTTLRVAIVITLMAAGAGPPGVVIGVGLGSVLSSVAYLVVGGAELFRRWGRSPLKGSLSALGPQRGELARFLLFNNVSRGISAVLNRADTLIVGAFVGPAGAAFYNLANNAAGLPLILTSSLQDVAYPELVRSESSRPGGARERAGHLTAAIGAPLGTLTFLAALAVPFVVPAVLGNSYQPAGIATALLLVGTSSVVFGFALRPLYLATDRIRMWTALTAAAAAVYVPGFALLTWRMGIQGGAAYAAVIQVLTILVAARLGFRDGRSPAWRPA